MNAFARRLSLALVLVPAVPAQNVGYDDTPRLPGSRWRVHDGERPQPAVVRAEPGRPPSDAVVLFDGTDLSAWKGRGGEAKWELRDGAFIVNGTGDIETKRHFGDCQLHIEWATPAEVKGSSQGRGNSGVYLMGRYEVQVLDSFDNPTYPDGQAAALYGQDPPLVNASRAPGAWQTYDIIFEAPRFSGDRLVEPGYTTVLHNGVVVHHRRRLIGASTHRRVAEYRPHPAKGPLKLQDHGNPIRFRNVWVRELGPYPGEAQLRECGPAELREAIAEHRGKPLIVTFCSVADARSRLLSRLDATRARLAADGGEVVGVAVGASADASRAGLHDAVAAALSPVLLLTSGSGEISEQYRLPAALPATVAIDSSGAVVAVHAGVADESELEALIDKACRR